MGSPEIGARVLEGLLDKGLGICAVITRPDRPKGRGQIQEETPVKIVALRRKLALYQPGNKTELTAAIREINPDLCIVAAFGMIIPNEALALPKYGMINFHPSLLPKLRGPSPIPMAIMGGDQKTGVTIIQVEEKMDAGDILAQEEVALSGDETTPTLSEKLARVGTGMILETVQRIEENNLMPMKQDETKATFTSMVKKENGEIIFKEDRAGNIEQAARAFTPWPGVFTFWKGKRLELFEPEVMKTDLGPGKVAQINDKLVIGTAEDAIAPKYLKLEGKQKQTAKEFLCGYQDFIGSKLN